MGYTNEEVGMIEAMIQSYFAPSSVSEQLRDRYWATHQHMEQNQLTHSDLVNIKKVLSFLLPSFSGERQLQKDLFSALIKTNALLKSAG